MCTRAHKIFYSTWTESQGLPASILECKLCFEVVEKAVHCVRCKKFICERHKANLRECPFCRLVPLKVEVDYTLRDLVDQLPIECSLCHQHITKGELDIHTKHCTQPPRECGVDGCAFQTTNKSEALRHVMAVHGNELWENFKQLTAAGSVLMKRVVQNKFVVQKLTAGLFHTKLQISTLHLHTSALLHEYNCFIR